MWCCTFCTHNLFCSIALESPPRTRYEQKNTLLSLCLIGRRLSHCVFGLWWAGISTIAVGIPLVCVGKSQKRKSYETFNNTSGGYISSSELQFKINNDGVGLALMF